MARLTTAMKLDMIGEIATRLGLVEPLSAWVAIRAVDIEGHGWVTLSVFMGAAEGACARQLTRAQALDFLFKWRGDFFQYDPNAERVYYVGVRTLTQTMGAKAAQVRQQ